jgi:hypothetical protein
MNIRPMNGNIVIRFKKNYTELITASGIVLPNVEQDMNIAEVVAVPEDRKYQYKVYDTLGTPVRNEDGSIKEAFGFVTVNLGDKVVVERRQHADYESIRDRFIIKHCVEVPETWLEGLDRDYDYFFIRFEDVLGTVEGDVRSNDVHGDLFPIAPPKAIALKR